MNRYLFLTVLASFAFSDAFAQDVIPAPAPAPDMGQLAPIAASPNATPVQQNMQMSSAVIPGVFPALPPSRPCEERDLLNTMWKLKNVYEVPPGPVTGSFAAQQTQFYIFNPDKTYFDYKSAYSDKAGDIKRRLNSEPQTTLRQFVMHESGILFYYKDGVVSESNACFIVANERQPFQLGQMLLMPPADQATTSRLVRVYQKIGNSQPKQKTLDNQDGNQKKKRHRRNITIHRQNNNQNNDQDNQVENQ